MLTWLIVVALVLVAWFGVALVAVTLPGIWLMVASAIAVELWRPEILGTWVLVTLVSLGVLGEVVEFVSSMAGSKRAGGTRAGAWGSLVGTLVGMLAGQVLIPVPILGAVVGGVVGAGVGALGAERGVAGRGWRDAWRSGRGAATGRALSIVLKTGVAAASAAVLTVGAVAALF